MDFDDTAEEAEFRAQVRAWLEKYVEPRPGNQTPEQRLSRAKRLLAAKAAAGYAAITWPKALGGLGGTEIQSLIFSQEEARFDVETLQGSDFFAVGLQLCAGTILRCATPEQIQRFIPPLVQGEKVWCQLFSEPSGGSDLAAVRTRALRDGDDWLITGQKVWTTGGHFADFGLALTRTDASLPKHQGLTMFAIDMHTAGVDVRPIRQMSGESEFNEVFLDGVRVPDSCRIGAVNGGWKVALTTLGQERSTAATLAFVECQELINIAREAKINGRPAISDGRVRERLAECWLNTFGMRLMSYRSQTALGRGVVPGPEESLAKLIIAPQGQRSAMIAMDILGVHGCLTAEELGEHWQSIERAWFWAPAFRIAGGTDEILRTILAERVLRLPADIRIDRDVPFNGSGAPQSKSA